MTVVQNVQKLFGRSHSACNIRLFCPNTLLDFSGMLERMGAMGYRNSGWRSVVMGQSKNRMRQARLSMALIAIAGSRKKKPCSRFPTLGFHGFGKMRERWGESAGVFNGYRNKRTVVRRKCVRVEGSRACVNHENVGRHRFGETLDVLYSILAASAEATSRLPLFSVFSRPTSCHPTSRLSP